MKPSQILLTICLTTSLGLAGCNLSSPPRAPADSSATPASIATIPSTPSTAMPLPTLPAGRQPLAVETPVTITITTTREPARAERIALVFQLRGGFAGKNDMWTIYQSGLIRSNKGTDQHVDPQIVQTLLTEIDKLGYFSLAESYPAACADCFEYRLLAYHTNGDQTQTKAVVATDDGKLPETLLKVVAAVQDIVAPTK